jgi:hypothetical protein
MDDKRFWSIIEECDTASGGDMDRKDRLVRATIEGLPAAEAETFHQTFCRMMDLAYTWELWGAAYVINGGCGDDAFLDFRASLISRGCMAFQSAIRDPDSLAECDINLDAWFHEGFQYAVTNGAEAALGRKPSRGRSAPVVPSGARWAEAMVHHAYPRLSFRMATAQR